jgi:hypothetical protein
MDATTKSVSNPTPVYFYFYLFRLLMTLVIMPILLSFLVRSSVALNDKIKNERQARLAQTRLAAAYDEERRAESDKLSPPSSPTASPPPSASTAASPWSAVLQWVMRLASWLTRRSARREGARAQREMFSQYNICASKHSGDMAFASIWTADAGAGESLQFLQIQALSTQLENLKYNLDYHCEVLLRLLDKVDLATRGSEPMLRMSTHQVDALLESPRRSGGVRDDRLGEGEESKTQEVMDDEEVEEVILDEEEEGGEDGQAGVVDGDEEEEEEELVVGQFMRQRARTRESLVSYMMT